MEPLIRQARKRFKLTMPQARFAWRRAMKDHEEDQTASYAWAVGRKTSSAKVKASQAVTKGNVKDAIAWIREESGKLAAEVEDEFAWAAERARTIRFLWAVRAASVGQIFADGLVLGEQEWKELPDAAKDLIDSMDIETVKEGDETRRVVTKVKLKSWAAAQKMLIDIFGLDAPKKVDPKLLELLGRFPGAAELLPQILPELQALAEAEKERRKK